MSDAPLPRVKPHARVLVVEDDADSSLLFAALMDGNCISLLLQNPPATLDTPGNPNGRGEALELLNVLQITDVYQLPALAYPTKTYFIGDISENYEWPKNTLGKLDIFGHLVNIEEVSQFQ